MSKKTKGKTVVAIMVVVLLTACRNSDHTPSNSDSQDSYQTNDNIENYDSNGSEYVDNDYNDGDETDASIKDGTYSATVDYYNPDTDYSNTYTLDVEVEDNKIVQIDFLNDGYLDDTHIEPQELDEDEHCSIEDDEGRTFDIQLDL